MFTKICNTWSSGYYVSISPSMLSTRWTLWTFWRALGCDSASPLSPSPPWSLLSSWSWSFSSTSSSWLSWSRPCAGGVVSFRKVYWGWLLEFCGLTSPITILYRVSHGAFSSSTRSRSTFSFWEPVVLSNIASHVVSTQLGVTLKTWYVREFESYPSKKPS
jgi:hypothetical protein